jgi:hypothetical protein
MKTDLIRFTTQLIKNLRGVLAGLIATLIFFNVLPKAWSLDLFWADNATSPATAGSGTWIDRFRHGQGDEVLPLIQSIDDALCVIG